MLCRPLARALITLVICHSRVYPTCSPLVSSPCTPKSSLPCASNCFSDLHVPASHCYVSPRCRNTRSIARHANVVRTKIASPGPLLCCCCMMTYLSNLVMISNTTFTNSVAKLTGSCTMPCLLCAPCTISMYPRHVRACAFLGVPCSMMHMCAPVHDVPQSLRYYAGDDSLHPR